MIPSYRDSRYAASIRIEHLRERAAQDIPRELIHLHARRVARTAAGTVAVAGAVVVAFGTAFQSIQEGWFGGRSGAPRPTLLLIAAVLLSVVTYVVTRVIATWRFPGLVRAALVSDRDELVQLARLESGGLARAAAGIAGAGEERSLSMPMAGIALLAPLTIHLVVSMLFTRSGLILSSFDTWIRMSLVLVGLGHVVLAGLCVRFARRVARVTLAELEWGSPASGWAALGWTVLASCLPGAIALLIPPILVAATGLPVVPVLFRSMYERAVRERRLLRDYA